MSPLPGDRSGTDAADVSASTFSHVGHCVTDLTRSRRFYEGLLGFAFERVLTVPEGMVAALLDIAPPVRLTAAYLRRDGLVLELMEFGRDGNPVAAKRVFNEPGLTHLSLYVPDLAAVLSRVESYGGHVVADSTFPGVTMVRDPDGQLIELLAMRSPGRDRASKEEESSA